MVGGEGGVYATWPLRYGIARVWRGPESTKRFEAGEEGRALSRRDMP
jgi:hypothetical protein